jgi:uncharacterized protein YceK
MYIMFKRVILISALILLSGCASSKTYTNSDSKKLQLNTGVSKIHVELQGSGSREDATNQVTNALSIEGYRISEANAEAGIIQTSEQEFDGDILGSSATIRLNITLEDSDTAVVNGEYINTSLLTGQDSWKTIEYGGPKGSQDTVSWNELLDVAEKLGTVIEFSR